MEVDHGSHEEMHGGRMLPENKQVLDQLYDPKQSQGEFTGRALLDPATTRLRPKDAMQFWSNMKRQQASTTPSSQVIAEDKTEVLQRNFWERLSRKELAEAACLSR